ncbi:MAG: polysaccharide biosynthesis/export family protein [Maricaulaceae bacterium]
MLRPVIAVALGLFAAACASTGNCGVDPTEAARPIVEYRLGAGDELRVTVYGEERLSGEFVVGGQGHVALPLVGDVLASGKTLPELEQAIEASLANGYLVDPRVSIQILNYRPYYISGEVNNPGQYPYMEGLTLQSAIAIAGDFTYRANRCRVFIQRADSNSFERYVLMPDTLVQPGDTIRIPESIL